jgi:hypothetical protein
VEGSDLMFPVRLEPSNPGPGLFAMWRVADRTKPLSPSQGSHGVSSLIGAPPPPYAAVAAPAPTRCPSARGGRLDGPALSPIKLDQAPEWQSLEPHCAMDSEFRQASWSQDRGSSQDAEYFLSPPKVPLSEVGVPPVPPVPLCEAAPSLAASHLENPTPFGASFAALAEAGDVASTAPDVPSASSVDAGNSLGGSSCPTNRREALVVLPGAGGGHGGVPCNAPSTSGRSTGGSALPPAGSVGLPSPSSSLQRLSNSGGSFRSMDWEGCGSPLRSPQGSARSNLQV